MTLQERHEHFIEWCERRKRLTGNHFYWFPQENHIPPAYYECVINGKRYRGTKEEIIQESNMPDEIAKDLKFFPEEMNWRCDDAGIPSNL